MSPSSIAFHQAQQAACGLTPCTTSGLHGTSALSSTCLPGTALSISSDPVMHASGGYEHHRTLSGQYYCPSCHVTVSSACEMHYHMSTRRHQTCAAMTASTDKTVSRTEKTIVSTTSTSITNTTDTAHENEHVTQSLSTHEPTAPRGKEEV